MLLFHSLTWFTLTDVLFVTDITALPSVRTAWLQFFAQINTLTVAPPPAKCALAFIGAIY